MSNYTHNDAMSDLEYLRGLGKSHYECSRIEAYIEHLETEQIQLRDLVYKWETRALLLADLIDRKTKASETSEMPYRERFDWLAWIKDKINQ